MTKKVKPIDLIKDEAKGEVKDKITGDIIQQQYCKDLNKSFNPLTCNETFKKLMPLCITPKL